MSSDLSAEIAAIATAALAAFAIITALLAFLAYRKQKREVGVLLEQHDRDVSERRIAQAARVFTVVPRGSNSTALPSAKNASDLPVFDAQFWYSEPDGASGPDDLGRIMPGDMAGLPDKAAHRIRIGSRDLGEESGFARTILTFRDAAGVRWIRMPDGALEEQSCATARESALVALGVKLPMPGLRPPGPGGKHKLPTSFRRIGRLGFVVSDTIVVYPLSKGTVDMRGSIPRGLPLTMFVSQVKVTSDDPDNQGVYTEERLADSPPAHGHERYTVSYDVWNYRDSPVTVELVGQDQAADSRAWKEANLAALEREAEAGAYPTGDPFGPVPESDWANLFGPAPEVDWRELLDPAPEADAGESEAD